MKYRTSHRGFTLVEMLIVIALIGILAAALVEKMDAALSQARDSRRKMDLHKLQNALMTYYARNGNFPATPGGAATWNYSSEPDPAYSTNGGNWIPGLAPTYIAKLPRDPKGGRSSNPACTGSNYFRQYLYRSDGQSFKLLSYCAPELLPLSASDPMSDPGRSTSSLMVCMGYTACNSW